MDLAVVRKKLIEISTRIEQISIDCPMPSIPIENSKPVILAPQAA
jgi:hypothetical protein